MVSRIDVWQPASVNRSNRPILQEGEHNLYVRDNIGLYQGKLKIVNRQNGRVYLTNKRIIYLDNEDVKKSMAIELKNVSSGEVIERFLRSSPKVKLYLKEQTNVQQSSTKRSDSNRDKVMAHWVCIICSFNNQILVETNLDGDLPKCGSCGIKPSRDQIVNSIERRRTEIPTNVNNGQDPKPDKAPNQQSLRDDQCPKCTFINHPALKYCELCGSELNSSLSKNLKDRLNFTDNAVIIPEDVNPMNILLENDSEVYTNNKPYIKLSFRKNGESQFYQILADMIGKIKWEKLVNKGTINENGVKVNDYSPTPPPQQQIKGGGIHGLEQIGEQQRKQNELVLSTSLEDLEQLMYKAQDLIKLSCSFGKLVKTTPQNINTIIPPLNIKKTSNLYHQELARHISEYLTNFQLTKSSSMITSQDLYAYYNRYLVSTQGFGTDLIPHVDFNKSLNLFDSLKLPIALKNYERSGLIVICYKRNNDYSEFIVNFLRSQERLFTHDKVKNEILMSLEEQEADQDGYIEENYKFFKGNTIPEICDELGWSYGITIEEIEKCIESGLVVIDQNILGTFYFINRFMENTSGDTEITEELVNQIKQEVLLEQKNITENLKQQYYLERNQNLINFKPEINYDSASPGSNVTPISNANATPAHGAGVASYSLNDLQGLNFS